MSKYILDNFHQISDRINDADKVFLFLDYDGTLVSFKDRPQDVITSSEVKTVINHLVKNRKYTIVIVTGRTLYTIKKLLDLKGISFAALHGLQMELSNGTEYRRKPKNDLRMILEKIKKLAEDKFQNEKGIYFENKELTLAFHYRRIVEEKIQDVVTTFLEIVKNVDISNCLDILYGAKVVEVRPKGWNKGKAVELILNKIGKSSNYLPVYIGDDTTDEDACRSIGNDGITIFVSNNANRQTKAQYWLKDPDDVLTFLKSLQAR